MRRGNRRRRLRRALRARCLEEHLLQNQEGDKAAGHDDEHPSDEQSRAAWRFVAGALGPCESELGVQQLDELLWRWFGRSGFVHGVMNDSNVWFFPR